ncbi:hypothetical protein AVEN_192562-1 [Araneus ventricosus]|uniref:Uncharacterized protein n=1 Tax=Araneus ventricosus TaxID=182803 RepID=A0A4Y2AW14_ARAVE|nr:hypothetical protein AVEN_192562-1 [Araneus ventricosus]
MKDLPLSLAKTITDRTDGVNGNVTHVWKWKTSTYLSLAIHGILRHGHGWVTFSSQRVEIKHSSMKEEAWINPSWMAASSSFVVGHHLMARTGTFDLKLWDSLANLFQEKVASFGDTVVGLEFWFSIMMGMICVGLITSSMAQNMEGSRFS